MNSRTKKPNTRSSIKRNIKLTGKKWRPHNLNWMSSPLKIPLRLASIDIGSNAIRLFVGQNTKSGKIRVLKDMRASVRLGKDAFTRGYIRPLTLLELEKALKQFRIMCDNLRVHHIQAVGTSALRDSHNGLKIIKKLQSSTGIKVHVINGMREANLLFRAVTHAVDLRDKNAILMDMGGGSLEIVMSQKGHATGLQSLPLGTVRLLSRVGIKGAYEDYAQLIRSPLYRLRVQSFGQKSPNTHLLIGTGGNLRALGKLCERLGLSRSRTRFTRHNLEVLTQVLFKLSNAQRIKRFQLRKDRADVILPAAVVTLELMRIFEIETILVPNVGIKNGLFWESVEKIGRRSRKSTKKSEKLSNGKR